MNREEATSSLLYEHWTAARLEALPAEIRPATCIEGYRVQTLFEKRSAAALFGWKIAATSTAGQAHIGVDCAIAGRLLAERVIADGASCPFGNMRFCIGEILLAASHLVTTGTGVAPMAIAPGDRIRGDIRALGAVFLQMELSR